MCTVSWRHEPGAGGAYTLWFNRDERHQRAAEEAPGETTAANGRRYLAPVDGSRGGTWLAVNAGGLTLALLNDYLTPDSHVSSTHGAPRRSRGTLVRSLAGEADSTAVDAALRAAGALEGVPPFFLLAVSAEGAGAVAGWHWNGVRLRACGSDELAPPWSSSSYLPAEVVAVRRSIYASRAPRTVGDHRAYHRFHEPASGAFSVNMRRAEAATRSICEVAVTPQQVELGWEPQAWPGAPRAAGPAAGVRLRLTRE